MTSKWEITLLMMRFLTQNNHNSFKNLPYFCFLIYHLPQFLQSYCVWRFGEPKLQISVATVFFVKVLHHAVVLLLFGELRIVIETVLDGALYDCFWVDKAVGFGNDATIDGARLVFC